MKLKTLLGLVAMSILLTSAPADAQVFSDTIPGSSGTILTNEDQWPEPYDNGIDGVSIIDPQYIREEPFQIIFSSVGSSASDMNPYYINLLSPYSKYTNQVRCKWEWRGYRRFSCWQVDNQGVSHMLYRITGRSTTWVFPTDTLRQNKWLRDRIGIVEKYQ